MLFNDVLHSFKISSEFEQLPQKYFVFFVIFRPLLTLDIIKQADGSIVFLFEENQNGEILKNAIMNDNL